jgi:hypothetical protein
VTIDGSPITVPLGTTILEAARELQIRIPTLCFHEDLCLAGYAGSASWRSTSSGPCSRPAATRSPRPSR